MYDIGGKEYIDLDAGWGALGLGHCHPEIVEATRLSVETLEHTTPPSRPMITLMDSLSERLLPYDLVKFFFGTSGSESVEHALMLLLAGKPGANKVLVFDRGYHGSSIGLMPLSFKEHPLKGLSGIEPVFVPTPFCYRCSFGLTVESCARQCEAAFESLLEENKDQTCGVLIEPILGREAISPPEGYLNFVSKQCKAKGVPLVIDEIKTGMGRCGANFAFELEGMEPDLLCLGKSLSNGFPLSLVVFKEDRCPRDFLSNYIILQSTFSGHVSACARANKSLEIIERDQLPARSVRMGKLLREAVSSALEGYPYLGEVRGTGLLCAVEFVVNGESKEPSIASANHFLSLARECGIHLETVFRNVVVFTPPLTITEEDISEVYDRLSKGFSE